MVVGEAPGYEEDREGYPFVGRSGQLLNTLLTEYGFDRSALFVTNAVRCRPVTDDNKNRTPTLVEQKACRTYLQQDLERVQPQIVLALGNIALKALTGLSGVTKYRGKPLPIGGEARVFATLHPAAALRMPQMTDQIREDLQLVRRQLEGSFTTIAAPWEWTLDPQSGSSEVVAFDVETNARELRDPFTRNYLAALDTGLGNVQVCDQPAKLIEQLQRASVRVGHNASRFDRLRLDPKLHCDDTMLMAWLLHEDWGPAKRLNLQSLCTSLLGVEPWKEDVSWNWRDATTIPWEQAAQYCARDTRYTRELFLHLRPQLQADPALWRFYQRLALPASRALSNMEERGLWVNREHVAQARTYYEQQAVGLESKIAQIAASHGLENFNARSTKQLGELLYKRIGFDPIKFTPGGAVSTDVEALKQIRELGVGPVEILNDFVAYRKTQKMLGTYIAHFEDEPDCWGNWFPWTSMTNTVTGRTAGNAQQIPREPRIRRCVAAPPGKVLLQADFSQLEMRVAASRYCFNEGNMRAAFVNGDDVHRLLAAEITHKDPKDVTKEERARAKPANFLMLYGGEEQTYIRSLLEDYDIVKPYEEARAERDAYFRRWNQLPAGHARVVSELQNLGQVRSALGTIRRLPNIYATDRRVMMEAMRQAINYADQSLATHIALIGQVLLEGYGLDTRSFQHDAYLIFVDDNERAVMDAAVTVKHVLEVGVSEVLRDEFGLDWDVPLVADIVAGTAWTQDDRLCEHGIWMPKVACSSCNRTMVLVS